MITLKPGSHHGPYLYTDSPKTTISPENAYYLDVMARSAVFPGDSVAKNPLAMQETQVQSLGRECLLEKEMATHSMENPMDREAWQATVHGIAKRQTGLSD